jgi:succinate dehydrogenase / fumarate reductase flavoprotein subunit
MVWPSSVRGILVTEGVRGDGGILLNNKNERFMFNYIPPRFAGETAATEEEAQQWLDGKEGARRPPELLTRDVVARAIKTEVEEGRGSPHGGVFLDIASRRPADFIKRKLPSMYHQFKELAEIDITKEPMEVGPTLHYFMGGIRVHSDTQQTTVDGLFACGECAAGMHGANRLGGNSLSDLLVFGKLAGDGAIDYVKKVRGPLNINDAQVTNIIRGATNILNRESGSNPFLVHEDLQEVMQKYVGIVRTKNELNKAINELKRLRQEADQVKAHASAQYNPGWNEAIDLQNLLITSEAVARSALMREESRGAHTRVDFETESDHWVNYNVLIRKAPDNSMEVEKVLRKDPPQNLKKIAYASLDELEGDNG